MDKDVPLQLKIHKKTTLNSYILLIHTTLTCVDPLGIYEYERHGPVRRAQIGPTFWHTASPACRPVRRFDQPFLVCKAAVF